MKIYGKSGDPLQIPHESLEELESCLIEHCCLLFISKDNYGVCSSIGGTVCYSFSMTKPDGLIQYSNVS